MGLDYYYILGIQRNADHTEICRAYRRLALQFHPCRSKDNEISKDIFKDVSEAYDVLSDSQKRAIFDQFGEDGLKNRAPFEGAWSHAYVFHGDPHRTFMEFFGKDNPFEQFSDEMDYLTRNNFGGPRGRGQPKQDPPIERDLHLTLEEIYNGCIKKMKISRRILNNDEKTSSIRDKVLTVTVRPGWLQGTRITFAKEGDQGPNNIPADVVFILHDQPHPQFRREGADLVFVSTVPLGQALIGCVVDVATLDGRIIHVPITEIIHPSYEKVVHGEGMPLANDETKKGDLRIRFDIQFPRRLTTQQKLAIEQALFS